MSELQVALETREGLERALKVQVPAARIDAEVNTRLQSVGRTAKIKGFRPGKVPAKVLHQRYGDQVRQEVLKDVIESSYAEAIARNKLRPVGNPNIEPDLAGEGQDFTFTAVFEVFPEIELAPLDGLKIERPTVSIIDSDVDGMIDNLRYQRATWTAVDRPAKEDDRVRVDFDAQHNGEPLEGGKGEDVPVVIGEGRMVADFERSLVGMKANEEKTFPVKFPKEYHEESLAGAKTEFTVHVREVAELQLPEVDEAFVKSFGIESGKLEDMRADVLQNMNREAESRVRTEMKQGIMDALLAANTVEVPRVMVQEEAVTLRAEAMRQMNVQDSAKAPDINGFMEAAERRTRLGLLLGAVINSLNIQVNPDKVKEKIDEVSAPYDESEEIAKLYYQTPELLRSVETVVLEDQVVDRVLEVAYVSDRKLSFNELMKD